MNRSLLLAVVILAEATALADGGAVALRQEAGGLVITVFTSPPSLSVGLADISVLLQNGNGLEPVLDADLSLVLRAEDSGLEVRARPTREQARNKLLYAAPVVLSRAGKWQFFITGARHGLDTNATGIIDVAPAPGRAVSYAGYIAFPPVMIALFVVRERLIRRRSMG